MTAARTLLSSSNWLIQRPETKSTWRTLGNISSVPRTGIGTVSNFSRASSYGVTTIFESSTTAETFSTVVTVNARSTASVGRVGFCPPNELEAAASIRLVPSFETFCFRSPFAESVSPTDAIIAATPIIGPRSSKSVRTLRASNPVRATRTRSLNVLISEAPHQRRFRHRALISCGLLN